MLVLSRKKGEKLIIGDTVITVCQIRGGTVKIGVDAPADVCVRRGELPADVRLLKQDDDK